jgi:hypothetical protein
MLAIILHDDILLVDRAQACAFIKKGAILCWKK